MIWKQFLLLYMERKENKHWTLNPTNQNIHSEETISFLIARGMLGR